MPAATKYTNDQVLLLDEMFHDENKKIEDGFLLKDIITNNYDVIQKMLSSKKTVEDIVTLMNSKIEAKTTVSSFKRILKEVKKEKQSENISPASETTQSSKPSSTDKTESKTDTNKVDNKNDVVTDEDVKEADVSSNRTERKKATF